MSIGAVGALNPTNFNVYNSPVSQTKSIFSNTKAFSADRLSLSTLKPATGFSFSSEPLPPEPDPGTPPKIPFHLRGEVRFGALLLASGGICGGLGYAIGSALGSAGIGTAIGVGVGLAWPVIGLVAVMRNLS